MLFADRASTLSVDTGSAPRASTSLLVGSEQVIDIIWVYLGAPCWRQRRSRASRPTALRLDETGPWTFSAVRFDPRYPGRHGVHQQTVPPRKHVSFALGSARTAGPSMVIRFCLGVEHGGFRRSRPDPFWVTNPRWPLASSRRIEETAAGSGGSRTWIGADFLPRPFELGAGARGSGGA